MESQPLRDRAIAADIADVLANDDRFCGLDLSAQVIGGVVHLRGRVAGEQSLTLRRSLSRVRGVHAVWALLTNGECAPPRIFDLGCGNHKQWPEAQGMDSRRAGAVDLLGDLNSLPFATDSLDTVFAIHVLEHLPNLIGAMQELHRVIKPDGELHIMVPDRRAPEAYADPTHVRFFNLPALRYFCEPHEGLPLFWPTHASSDGTSIFADFVPVKDGLGAPDEQLARAFDN
jgi:SAM-dependent methyltransferase